MAVTIQNVAPGSPAEKAWLQPGMRLVRINGHEIRDGLDYEFYSTAPVLALELLADTGPLALTVQKSEYEPLGCEFASYLIDGQHSCRNKCVFCFVDQMPKGLRKSLYFKDDDERLSFLFGNYVTLTNLTDREIERIIEMHISPVNISVHTANPALRVEMMKNKHAGEVLRFIPKLAGAGVSLNTQLVLCPGLNDGEELRRSIEWLSGFAPALQSIAAVPVGLTKFRQGLYPLQPYTAEQAAAQLDIMLEYGERLKAQHGTRIVYPSDEWFLLAGRPIPQEDFYDGYLQLENGIGLWRLLHDEFIAALDEVEEVEEPIETDIVVGELVEGLFNELSAELNRRFPSVTLHVHAIRNDFFGPLITVTGLVTGQDIIAQVKGKLHSGTLLMPSVMLRAEGDLLLDDTTPDEIEAALDTHVVVVPEGGENLLYAALGAEEEEE